MTVDPRLVSLLDFEEVASRWQKVITSLAYSPLPAREVRLLLAKIAEDATGLLWADHYDSSQGQEIGRRLSALHLLNGNVLSQSVTLLLAAWNAQQTLWPSSINTERIPVVLGDIAGGYFASSTRVILREQEEIRAAQLVMVDQLHQNLQAQHQELQNTNELLRIHMAGAEKMARELAASEERFRGLFEDSPVALWLFDGTETARRLKRLQDRGAVDIHHHLLNHPAEAREILQSIKKLAANQQAVSMEEATFGVEVDLEGPALTAGSTGAVALAILAAVADGRTYLSDTLDTLAKDGRVIRALYTWSVPESDRETYGRMFLSIVDISAQVTAEEALQLTAERLQTLHDVEAAILATKSSRAIAEVALQHISRIIDNLRSATVNLIDEQDNSTEVLAAYNSSTSPGDRFPIANPEQLERLRRNEVVRIDDLQSLSDPGPGLLRLLQYGGLSLLSVPLLLHGDLIGILSLTGSKPNAFGTQEIEICRQIANSVAISLYNAQLLETEQRARTVAETMREVAASLSTRLDRTELLDVILSQLALVLPYDGAAIFLYESNLLYVAATKGRGPLLRSPVTEFLEQLPRNLRRLVDTRVPVIISDTTADPDWILLPEREYIRSWLGVPLLERGELRGILALDKGTANFYDAQAIELAEAFASQAAIALENARLYQQVQGNAEHLREHVAQRTRQLRTLYDITALVSKHLDLQTILDLALARTVREFDCAAGAILTLDETATRLLLLAHHALDADQIEFLRDVAASSLLFPKLQEQHETIAIVHKEEFPAELVPAFGRQASCYAAALMRLKGEPLGMIALFGDVLHEFGQAESQLLSSIADHLAGAIENAGLRKESEKLMVLQERERLARDLHDSATQSLYSLTLFSAAAREQIRAGHLRQAALYLDEVDQMADQTHREMRLLLHELSYPEVGDESLAQAIQRRLRMVEARSGVRVQLIAPEPLEIPDAIRRELYKVASEALTNALKHGHPQTLRVELRTTKEFVTLLVVDDGRGFDTAVAYRGMGMGLTNMRQRMRSIGGEFELESTPQQGTRVTATVPRPT